MASFNRKLKKQQEKKNIEEQKKQSSEKIRNKELLNNYRLEIESSKLNSEEKSVKIEDELVLENLQKFINDFEEMGKSGKAQFEKGKADLAFAGIEEILRTKEFRVTTLRYFMLLIIFQFWDIASFHNSEEFNEACEESNLKLLQSGFWSDNLYVLQYINKYFHFSFSQEGTFNLEKK